MAYPASKRARRWNERRRVVGRQHQNKRQRAERSRKAEQAAQKR